MKTMSETATKIVPCPHCRGDSVFAPSNRWRPFCSARCREMDLGAWASESFRVEAAAPTEDSDLPH
ncbi:DNA gyrase inhibitor YacG [Paucibacter sp. APW11]|uniref:DNA gyrase inhibitor YacG n=1 Tax=Roseateles aquae TaxID=3077235 RepID=A0ABU3PJ02_9BURK|nr:DNA gyrase inhibitor YacG [Paucibacter sp. APW11]MDT9002122.1 DNA gyrase inhibitor YacG [Paucibacter sp. APW11]